MIPITACPICETRLTTQVANLNGAAKARYHDLSTRKYGGLIDTWAEGFDLGVLRCEACGHHVLSHQPEQDALFVMYAAGRPLNDNAPPSRAPTPFMHKEMRRFRKLMPQAESPSLLDYGSGFGRWARAAVAEGFAVTAYEPSAPRGQEDGPRDFELVHDLAALKDRRFAAINLEQVLEHVPDPVKTLTGLLPYCTPGAILRITTPNILRTPEGNALWAEWPFNGTRAHTMSPFEHLHGFTPASLALAASQAGFAPVATTQLGRTYPMLQLRRFMARFCSSMGQTLLLVQAPER